MSEFAVRRTTYILGGLLVLALIAYANSFSGVMLFDDYEQIAANPAITSLTPLTKFLDDSRPLVQFSWALNYAVGGLDPFGYHAVNFAIHALAGLTLFALLRRLHGARHPFEPIATTVAALWLVHPLNTEAVTYLVQRGEELMGLFYLLTLYCLVRSAEESPSSPAQPSPTKPPMSSAVIWNLAAVVACAAGMWSKAVMVTAPVTAFLVDACFLAGSLRKALRRRWKLHAALFATWGLLAVVGVPQGLTGIGGPASTAVGFAVPQASPITYSATQCHVVLHYLGLAAWPRHLCLDYGWPFVTRIQDAAVPIIVVVAVVVVAAWAIARKSRLGFWMVWFLLMLAPTSSLVPVKDAAFEHRMYLPLIGVIAFAVLAAAQIGLRILPNPVMRHRAAAALVAACLVCFTWRTVLRNRDYHDQTAMWRDVVTQRPDYARARLGLGFSLLVEGRPAEARTQFEEALKLKPNWPDALTNLGLALVGEGKTDEAIRLHQEALSQQPDHPRALVNLGAAYLKSGEVAAAVSTLERAVQYAPNMFEAHQHFADALVRAGKLNDAQRQFELALALRPHAAHVRLDRADLLADLGRLPEAADEYRRVLRQLPDSPPAHNNYGTVLRAQGDVDGAIREYQAALRLQPDYANAHLNLANAARQLGKTDDALAHYRVALRLDPSNVKTVLAFAGALIDLGQFPEALAHCQAALRQAPNLYLAHFYLGRAEEGLGHTREAVAAYRACLGLKPDFAPAAERLKSLTPAP